ncbi:Sterile alpha motif/pointed domain [Pseudocohnilembus persalinus]|uniref:non-specific serine/threonine protein kinase n=1 Tax=Pseudocohnilembus persalinus TaxID=266149 RepID=A0A0V0QV19_PSEPJ|nr:Sterile alpha motif/pointed domain [Pseudocohnilembus persalinus]|eukprot:KRX06204.1 Sterile alpha motif/pointed domain [Pseudocohnilembus persalinus]
MKEGQGKYYYKSGELYIGKWSENKRKGIGKYFYIDGERFVGMWDDDKKNGEGTHFYTQEGTWYRGNFSQGKKHGQGELHEKNAVFLEDYDQGVLVKKQKIIDVTDDQHDIQEQEEDKRVNLQVAEMEQQEQQKLQLEFKKQEEETKNQSQEPKEKQKSNNNNQMLQQTDVPNQATADNDEKSYDSEKSNNNQSSSSNDKPNIQTEQFQSQQMQSENKQENFNTKYWDSIVRSVYNYKPEMGILDSVYHSNQTNQSQGENTIEQLQNIELITDESLMGKLVTKWNTKDVGMHLDHIGLGNFKNQFIENEITGLNLFDLDEANLKDDFSMKLGQRLNFFRSLKSLKKIQKKNMSKQDIMKFQTFQRIANTKKQYQKSRGLRTPNHGSVENQINKIQEESSFESDQNLNDDQQQKKQEYSQTSSKSSRKSSKSFMTEQSSSSKSKQSHKNENTNKELSNNKEQQSVSKKVSWSTSSQHSYSDADVEDIDEEKTDNDELQSSGDITGKSQYNKNNQTFKTKETFLSSEKFNFSSNQNKLEKTSSVTKPSPNRKTSAHILYKLKSQENIFLPKIEKKAKKSFHEYEKDQIKPKKQGLSNNLYVVQEPANENQVNDSISSGAQKQMLQKVSQIQKENKFENNKKNSLTKIRSSEISNSQNSKSRRQSYNNFSSSQSFSDKKIRKKSFASDVRGREERNNKQNADQFHKNKESSKEKEFQGSKKQTLSQLDHSFESQDSPLNQNKNNGKKKKKKGNFNFQPQSQAEQNTQIIQSGYFDEDYQMDKPYIQDQEESKIKSHKNSKQSNQNSSPKRKKKSSNSNQKGKERDRSPQSSSSSSKKRNLFKVRSRSMTKILDQNNLPILATELSTVKNDEVIQYTDQQNEQNILNNQCDQVKQNLCKNSYLDEEHDSQSEENQKQSTTIHNFNNNNPYQYANRPYQDETSSSDDETISSSSESEEEKLDHEDKKRNYFYMLRQQSARANIHSKQAQINSNLAINKSVSEMGKTQKESAQNGQKSHQNKSSKKKVKQHYQFTDEEIQEKIKKYMDREKLNTFLIDSKELKWSSADKIGTGGYGEVYKGSWLGQDVAVKQYGKIKTRFSKRRAFDFISEVQVINNLRHPNIVLYMGVCITPTHYLLINEYLEQGSLFDHIHIKKSHIDMDRVLYIVEDIALGMSYLHARKVLHCDLKSPNVLVDQSWNVKLCDFGLSRIRDKLQNRKKRKKQGKIGTVYWMAPEIMREEEYNEKADVYSFGIILWELLARKIPYDKMSQVQIIGSVGYDDNFKLETPKNGPPELIKMMEQCLERNPKNRPDFQEIVSKVQNISKKGKSSHKKVIHDLVMFFGD